MAHKAPNYVSLKHEPIQGRNALKTDGWMSGSRSRATTQAPPISTARGTARRRNNNRDALKSDALTPQRPTKARRWTGSPSRSRARRGCPAPSPSRPTSCPRA
jgi:hypothetical protein